MIKYVVARRVVVQTLLIAGLVLSASAEALADTTTLVCNNPYQPSTPPFTLELDPVQNTVTQKVTASPNVAAWSIKVPATFDTKEIKYNINAWAYIIDRVTANVTANGDGGVVMNFPCHVAQKQF